MTDVCMVHCQLITSLLGPATALAPGSTWTGTGVGGGLPLHSLTEELFSTSCCCCFKVPRGLTHPEVFSFTMLEIYFLRIRRKGHHLRKKSLSQEGCTNTLLLQAWHLTNPCVGY